MKILALLLLFICMLLPAVSAQTYSQPMTGLSWNTHEISVNIPNNPTWATTGIEEAIADWNAAQSWFIQTYFPNETAAQFTFEAAQGQSHSLVKILYVSDVGQFWTGNTEVPTAGSVTNETILIVLTRLTTAKDMLQVVEHELGHVLGLDDTKIPFDLMFAAQDSYTGGEPTHPSTLNLYAVFLLANGCIFSSDDVVNLPPQIPYIEWYPSLNASNTETNVRASQPVEQGGCPRRLEFWQEPSFIFPLAVLVVLFGAYLLGSRRKKP